MEYISRKSIITFAFMMRDYLLLSKICSESNFYLHTYFKVEYDTYMNLSIEDIIGGFRNLDGLPNDVNKYNDTQHAFLNLLAALKAIDNKLCEQYYEEGDTELQIYSKDIPVSVNSNETKEKIWIAIGRKVWADRRFVVGNCMFSMIRAVIMNDKESDDFFEFKQATQGIKLFENDECTVFAAHAYSSLDLSTEAIKIDEKSKIDFVNTIDVKKDTKDKTGTPVKPDKYLYNSTKAAVARAFDACSNEAKIILFPELMLNEVESSNFENFLNEEYAVSKKQVRFIIIGEKHALDSKEMQYGGYGSYRNVASIYYWDGKKWKNAAKYNKIVPFSCNKLPTGEVYIGSENLLNQDESLCILPFKDCVAGVAICRDVLDVLNLDNPIHSYLDFIDVLFVPSYNEKETNMFMAVAETFARWHNCAVVYVNCLNKNDEQDSFNGMIEYSFAIAPYKVQQNSGPTSISGVAAYDIDSSVLKTIQAKCEYLDISKGYQDGVNYTLNKRDKVKYSSDIADAWQHSLRPDICDE